VVDELYKASQSNTEEDIKICSSYKASISEKASEKDYSIKMWNFTKLDESRYTCIEL